MSGVADFDPEKWSRSNGDAGTPAKTGETLATLATLAAPPLPEALRSGLMLLRKMDRPKMAQPENWKGIVADCCGLAADGWAQRALALGWSPLNLWGVSPATGGMVGLEGLGVWLNGRRVLLLDASSCIVENGPRSHSIFNRRSMGGAVLLWDLGRGK